MAQRRQTIEDWKQTALTPKGNPSNQQNPWLHVNKDDRTNGKDECAEYILTEILEKDRWPMDVSQIADEAGWSRQHARSVLREYFEPVDTDTSSNQEEHMRPQQHAREITIPDSVTSISDYLRGVSRGYELGENER